MTDPIEISAELGKHAETTAGLMRLVAGGLPGKTIAFVAKRARLTRRELSEALAIPERTLMAYQKRTRLPLPQSDRLYRLAYILAAATHAIGTAEKARAWLRQPNRALGGIIPLDAIRTEPGARQVESILGRIAYGGIS